MLRNSTKFARVWDAFFKKKSVPKMNDYRNIILEKVCSVELLSNSTLGTFFDRLKRRRNTALFIIYFCFLRLFRHPNYSLLFIASISFSTSSSLSSEKGIRQLWIRLLFPYVYWLTPKTTIIFLYHIILQNTTIFIIRISLSALNFARRTYKAIPHNYCRRIAPSDFRQIV